VTHKLTFALTAPGTDEALTSVSGGLQGPHSTFGEYDDGIWDLTRPERRPRV